VRGATVVVTRDDERADAHQVGERLLFVGSLLFVCILRRDVVWQIMAGKKTTRTQDAAAPHTNKPHHQRRAAAGACPAFEIVEVCVVRGGVAARRGLAVVIGAPPHERDRAAAYAYDRGAQHARVVFVGPKSVQRLAHVGGNKCFELLLCDGRLGRWMDCLVI
jgi:hypothetical protein